MARRFYFQQGNREVLPYLFAAFGWSESHGDLPDGTDDRGAGPAGGFGAGFHRMKDGPVSWGVEARLLRAAAGLRKAGVSGITVFAITTSLSWRSDPAPNPFGR